MMKNRRRKSLLPSPSMINLNLRKILRKVDRISALPDEILVNIVRFLPLDEAQATSVLSKRWRFIWQYMLDATMTLNFDAEKYLSLFASREDLAIPWYVDWVNKAIKQYRSQNVKLFRVCYDLDNVFSRSIDKWIHFAMSKGVEMLELDLLEYGVCRRKEYRSYKIPHKLLGLIKETVWKHVCSDVARLSPCACIGFKTLKVLNLKCVDVDGEVLQYMLCNCPVLERLSLYFAQSLVSLRVVGPSIALKYLEIRGCTRMMSVEICDSNLVSFVYYGSEIHLKIFNVPLLVEVAICQSCSEDYIPTTFAQLSRCLSQLEILKLIGIILPYKRNPVFPMFTNLKHLELRFEESDHCILLQLTSFLNASPCLHKLVLELYGLTGRSGETCHKAAKSSHDYLRVVEIYGYRGRTCDLSLVKFLTESAVNLEKIVTDSAHPAERHYCFPKHRRTPDIEPVAQLEQCYYEHVVMTRIVFARLRGLIPAGRP